MAQHLTDKQKKQIIADCAEMGSCNAVAKKHGRSWATIKRVVESDPDTTKKCEQKKEQNTADILEFMDKKKDDVCNIISLYLSELQNSDKLQHASIQSIATSLGIVIDKFTKDAEKKPETEMFENIVKAAGGKFETN